MDWTIARMELACATTSTDLPRRRSGKISCRHTGRHRWMVSFIDSPLGMATGRMMPRRSYQRR